MAAAVEGSIGERFTAQAKALEAAVIQQLQEKKAIEQLQSQLLTTGGLVRALEFSHTLQAQQIETNLRRALEVYEKARAMRQQQNQLLQVVSVLRRDLRTLRKAAGLPESSGKPHEDASCEGKVLAELPALAERLNNVGSAALQEVDVAAAAMSGLPAPSRPPSKGKAVAVSNASAVAGAGGSAPMATNAASKDAAPADPTATALEVCPHAPRSRSIARPRRVPPHSAWCRGKSAD